MESNYFCKGSASRQSYGYHLSTKSTQENRKPVLNVTRKHINHISYVIVGCAIEVHKQMGPGLVKSVYEKCLMEELVSNGLKVTSQIPVPVYYKDKLVDQVLMLDMLVEDLIIVELKAVETILPVFKAQLLSYLRLTGKPKGLLINFHCENIVHHLVPLVTEQFEKLRAG